MLIWGFLGDLPRNSSKFGEGDRGRVFKGFGDILGTESVEYWGKLGRNSPKIFEFQGGDGDNNFGEFANSIWYILMLKLQGESNYIHC